MIFGNVLGQLQRDASPAVMLVALASDVEALVGGRCVISIDEPGPAVSDWRSHLGERGSIQIVGGDVDGHDDELALATLVARGVLFEEREQSVEELRALLGGVLDGIITIDERGTVEDFNQAAQRMFGYADDEVIGENVSMLMGAEHRVRHDGYLERYRETGERRIIGIGREVEARKKDGKIFWIDLGVTEYRVRGIRKFTGILRDLTLRRELEEQLRQSQKLEAVGTLAAGVAHDFNNILMGIGGCLRFASSRIESDAPAQKFLQEAKNAADRGSRLTRQLLDFSRRTPTEHNPLALHKVVLGVEDMLGRLVDESLTIETKLLARSDTVIGDVSQLEQVIVNLVVNARDAMPGGGCIELETSNFKEGGATYVRFTVTDQGDGMNEATVARIFEPFFTTKSPDKGTGLGLSTVYGIIEAHAGRVRVRSVVGEGTTFEVDLPVVPED